MNKVLMTLAAGAVALSAQAAMAQEMTLAGAQALLSEIPGAMDCKEPSAPVIPSGATTPEPQMLSAIDAFKQFDTSSNDFRNCLDAAALNMGDALTDQHNQAITLVYDANASKVEALGAQVNEEIRAFNEANPG